MIFLIVRFFIKSWAKNPNEIVRKTISDMNVIFNNFAFLISPQ